MHVKYDGGEEMQDDNATLEALRSKADGETKMAAVAQDRRVAYRGGQVNPETPPPFEALEPEAAAVLQFIYNRQTPVRSVYPWPKVVERNDPCPCRSGRKFKVCCLRSTSTS
jgi:uncharacterized protein YecA (UPF0149 family)